MMSDDPGAENAGAQVRIFGTVTSIYTRIIQITCEEAGLSHETIATSAQSPHNRHPFGKVPVVEIDGLELIESVAITQYLDNRHGGGALQPRDPAKRAVMDKWVSVANTYLFPLFEHGLVMPWLMQRMAGIEPDPEKINNALPNISRALGFLEMEMQKDGAWTVIAGDAGVSLADVFLYPIVRSLQLTPQGEVGIGQCDHLSAWLATLKNRASITATLWEIEQG